MLRFEAYRKVIAAGLVLLTGLAANVVPGLDGIPAEAVQGVSGILAVIAVYAVENRLDGQSVDYLARVLRELAAEALDGNGAEDEPVKPDKVAETVGRAVKAARG